MIKVCPNPIPWNAVYQRLLHIGEARPDLPKPPVPLILNGWAFSNDIEKSERWQDTVSWAQEAGCTDLVSSLPDEDFYHVEAMSECRIGPLGGPMHRLWDFETKQKPGQHVLEAVLENLKDYWPELADGFSTFTRPIGFTGEKARRLLVSVFSDTPPPWGSWDSLSQEEAKRRSFTTFRKAANETIHPHEVDHIDFLIEARLQTP